jgi:hypothetical protein
MSNFPNSIDDDSTLPPINDNLTEMGGESINALRDAVFNIETELGLNPSGTTDSVSTRLAVSFFPDGTIKPSAITSLGLVTLPITQNQIANNANIPESKLLLDYSTQNLKNLINDLTSNLQTSLDWISATGIKLDPHIQGANYNHNLDHIEVAGNPNLFLKNKFNLLRDNAQAYNLIKDINNELVIHQQLDGSPSVVLKDVPTLNGGNYPSYYGHTASGIYLNTQRFTVIPQTAQDVQQLAEFIDSSSILLYGSRIQNLYSNGISKISRSSSLSADGYGDFIVPPTSAISYLLDENTATLPFDDIDSGDDIIEFKPGSNSNSFDAKFALVKPGDIVTINYGTIETKFIVKEKKYIQNGGNKKFVIRIFGKNLIYTTNASARIDRSLVNDNKFGVLALAAANNNFGAIPSLIVGSPRGASVTGVGFNPDQLSSNNYLLYLALYPTGNPEDGYTILPSIDVTGNLGTTPGKYNLNSVIEATNNAFRQSGYNYRFIAFSYKGEFGIKLADSYNNASFSILNACVNSNGNFDQVATNVFFKNNVVSVFGLQFLSPPDPLGFQNFASPPFNNSYGSAEAALKPVKIFRPLKRNNYYVNGIEKEKLTLEIGQALDGYGDGYWTGFVFNQNVFPSAGLNTGRVETTYRINQNLVNANLAIGKTLVIQSLTSGSLVDSGRFIIKEVDFGCNCADDDVFTDITVYDAVHATGVSPTIVLTPSENNKVKIYFNSDSVSFNKETATDFNNLISPFKRYFEIFIDEKGQTFSHERLRFSATDSNILINGSVILNTSSELKKLNVLKVSPKLLGYSFNSVKKITLHINSYDSLSGIFDGYLASFDQTNLTRLGSNVSGKKGQVVRFYDETNIDFIDVAFDVNENINSFTNQNLDFQLFPTMMLDDELMILGNCQFDELNNKLNYLSDERQFGNIAEKDLSLSAIDFIQASEKYLHSNGVIRGFDLSSSLTSNPNSNQIYLDGGLVLVNGKIIQMNNSTITIPTIKEVISNSLFNVNWALCVNDKSEYQSIPLLDFDSEINNPTILSRVFSAYNLVDGTTYNIDAISFSNLINNRKDLTILYVVSSKSQISNIANRLESIAINLFVSDARKFINDVDNNLPLRLTSNENQGNFRSPVSVLNWIKYNNKFNGNAIIKGSNNQNGIINSSLNLDFENLVTISGENNATLIMNGPVTLGSNLTFKDLKIVFNGGVKIASPVNNLIFDNCVIEYNAPNGTTRPIFPTTFSTTNNVFEIVNGNNIQFLNSELDINYVTPKSGGNVFDINNTLNFKFDGSRLDVNFNLTTNLNYPGDVFKFENSSESGSITSSVILGNFNKFVNIVSTNNIKITDTIVVSNYNPVTNTPADFNYSISNLVNSGQGWIYSSVENTLDSLFVDNVTFSYQGTTSNRFSFVNLELTNGNSVISNLKITNCKFNHEFAVGSIDDFRPAVAIVNISPNGAPNTSQPILRNVEISNNICNRNQSIIVTSKTGTMITEDFGGTGDVPNVMLYPGLVAQNCNITNNICGTIGYWVATDSKIVSLPNNVNSKNDKTNALNIEKNICHYIASMTSDGYYFKVSRIHFDVPTNSNIDVNNSLYPSGFVNIENNKANWIHTGISHEENSYLRIINNTLTAYDTFYLSKFKDDVSNTVNNFYKYAIVVTSSLVSQAYLSSVEQNFGISPNSNDCDCVIQNNSIFPGKWLSTVGDPISYSYGGYIGCLSSSTITNNVCKGIEETTGTGFGILTGGYNNSVFQNRIYRVNNSIKCYVGFNNFESDPWDGEESVGKITDNFFDSPYISNVTLDENVVNITPQINSKTSNWLIERNKNQTAQAILSLNSGQLIGYGTSGGFQQSSPFSSNYIMLPAPCTNFGFQSLVFRIADNATPGVRVIGWQDNLNKYLPNGVNIINAKMDVKTFGSAFTTPSFGGFNSTISLFLNTYDEIKTSSTNLDYFTAAPPISQVPPYAPGIADTAISSQSKSVAIGGALLNSTSNSIPMTITISDFDMPTFTTKLGKVFTVSVDIRFQRQASAEVVLYVSPIIIKYRW